MDVKLVAQSPACREGSVRARSDARRQACALAAPPDKAAPFCPGISYVAPHLNNLYFLPLCRRWGVYTVVRGLFLLKLGLSLLMLLAGPDRPGLLCFFIARYALPSLTPSTSAPPGHPCPPFLRWQQPRLHGGHL